MEKPLECDTQWPLSSWDILSSSNFSIGHISQYRKYPNIPLKIMQRPLNQELRKCQVQSPTKNEIWHVFHLKPAFWSWKRPDGKSSFLQMFPKSSKLWQSKWKYLLLSAVTIAKPRWDLLSWGQEGSYAIDRRRTIYSNCSSSGRVLYDWRTFLLNGFTVSLWANERYSMWISGYIFCLKLDHEY